MKAKPLTKQIKPIALTLLLAAFGLLASCERDSAVENAAEDVGDAVEEIGDSVEDAAD